MATSLFLKLSYNWSLYTIAKSKYRMFKYIFYNYSSELESEEVYYNLSLTSKVQQR